ncbi:SRPBCC family protein [Streptomyces sp. V4-01]|uniref:SRPBCC family protein n=1 Tax=Actinacidiphila polyblastidii TaxID=3110430 RepID=A0ABU7PJ47_9ACTN|nr:SRPBCC family protein [Streptomyces sp. V4-01]
MYDTSDSHPDIHWPSGFSPADAHSFHRAQGLVHGPPERAFTLLTDVSNWPNWVPECEEVSAVTLTRTFEVFWAGHRFEVFVGEHVPPRRIGWLGIGAGVMLYQAWLLTPTEDGTEIVVENAVRADGPSSLDTLSRAWAERLNELWLSQLEKLSQPAPGAQPES